MNFEETLSQIGTTTLGGVGARAYRAEMDGSLSFTISRGHRRVYVHLDGDDTYSVRTYMIRSKKLVFEMKGVYCDEIADVVWLAHLDKQ